MFAVYDTFFKNTIGKIYPAPKYFLFLSQCLTTKGAGFIDLVEIMQTKYKKKIELIQNFLK